MKFSYHRITFELVYIMINMCQSCYLQPFILQMLYFTLCVIIHIPDDGSGTACLLKTGFLTFSSPAGSCNMFALRINSPVPWNSASRWLCVKYSRLLANPASAAKSSRPLPAADRKSRGKRDFSGLKADERPLDWPRPPGDGGGK